MNGIYLCALYPVLSSSYPCCSNSCRFLSRNFSSISFWNGTIYTIKTGDNIYRNHLNQWNQPESVRGFSGTAYRTSPVSSASYERSETRKMLVWASVMSTIINHGFRLQTRGQNRGHSQKTDPVLCTAWHILILYLSESELVSSTRSGIHCILIILEYKLMNILKNTFSYIWNKLLKKYSKYNKQTNQIRFEPVPEIRRRLAEANVHETHPSQVRRLIRIDHRY